MAVSRKATTATAITAGTTVTPIATAAIMEAATATATAVAVNSPTGGAVRAAVAATAGRRVTRRTRTRRYSSQFLHARPVAYPPAALLSFLRGDVARGGGTDGGETRGVSAAACGRMYGGCVDARGMRGET